MSVMEMSHRGKEFISIADTAQRDLRELLVCPTTSAPSSCRAVASARTPSCH